MWAEGIKGGIWGCTEETHLGTPNPSLPSAQAAASQARLGEQGRQRTGLMHLPGGRGGDEKGGQGVSMVPQGAGELTLLIWSWVFLILWSSGVSATTLKPLPLFFSNSSL